MEKGLFIFLIIIVTITFSVVIYAEKMLEERGGTHKQIIERLNKLESIMGVEK